MLSVAPIIETTNELLAQLERKEWYQTAIERMGESRLREWLAVRVLLKKMLGEEKEIAYTAFGKPYLADGSYHISISHTKGFVAVVVDKEHPVAVDIERIAPRVENVCSRFLNEMEESRLSKDNRLIHLLLHWSAKETLFKQMDENDVELKTHLHIHPFEPALNQWATFNAHETRSAVQQSFTISYLVTDSYVLTVIAPNAP
ncbi:MAG: 4'-phosphopantetheinyl transferase superfamily protein [Dysgonamonadaceae bacterium]|jgi:phosphopantetheinyl transferase|nr:4'-phosphopantetheinyl transferase superfamily protein [Dysgonamonadaceae bacterium]